jgi:hypothetical protein
MHRGRMMPRREHHWMSSRLLAWHCVHSGASPLVRAISGNVRSFCKLCRIAFPAFAIATGYRPALNYGKRPAQRTSAYNQNHIMAER